MNRRVVRRIVLRMARQVSLGLAAPAIAVAFLAACGSDGTSDGGAPSTTASMPSEDEPGTAAPTTELLTTEPAGSVITVEVSGGAVVGGVERHRVSMGDEVTLEVTTDVADHVHVHGYDLFADVQPRVPARLAFTAGIPGVFEVELEERGLEIAQLEVS